MDFVETSQVTKALHALKVFTKKETPENKLFDDGSHLTLHLTLKKVPTDGGVKFVDTILPHPFLNSKTLSICLFVRDLDPKTDYKDHDVDKAARHFKQFLKEEKNVVGLDEIVALSQLKREYKTFESRRKLCSAYDLFLVDDRITNLVSGCLGKQFRASKKMPFSVRISRGNVNESIEKILSTTRFTFKKLSCRCSVKFGSINQSLNDLLENIYAVVESINKNLPGGISNVRSMNINLDKTPLMPIYVSLESANLVKIPSLSKQKPTPIVDELNTLDDEEGEDRNICVWADGRVRVVDSSESISKENRKRKISTAWKGSGRKRRVHKKSKKVKTTTFKIEQPAGVKAEES